MLRPCQIHDIVLLHFQFPDRSLDDYNNPIKNKDVCGEAPKSKATKFREKFITELILE